MRSVAIALIVMLTAGAAAAQSRTFAGVITDTMCNLNHKPMNVSPVPRCVTECVTRAKTVKYALASDGKAYILSDQETPAKLAGRRVKVTGVYYPKTNILAVEHIEPAN